MAINILDMFSNGVGKDLIGQASKALAESDSGTTSALGALMPALLGGMAQKASTTQGAADLFSMVNGASIDTRMLGNLSGLFAGGDRTNALTSAGGALASTLLGGDKVNALTSALASTSGIKASSAKTLLMMALPLLLAFLKKHIGESRLDANGLAGLLQGQKGFLEKLNLDPSITKALGFGSLASMLSGVGSGAADVARQAAGAASHAAYGAAGAAVAGAGAAKSGFAKWWPWILGLIVLWLLWSMFRGPDKPAAPVPAAPPQAAAPAAPAAPAPAAAVVTGGLPAKVYFDTGSAALTGDGSSAIARAVTEIKSGSGKVAITGYTDKTGDAAANEELAKNRAKAVRDALVAAGVPESSIAMNPPMFVTGTGNDAEARRVEITKGM